jgi:hypothetical protein
MSVPLSPRLVAVLLAGVLLQNAVRAQSVPLPTDRARVTVASIPDAYNPSGLALKVLRTDIGTPLRAGTAWIWDKDPQEQPESYYTAMAAKGLNAVRMILFDTWEEETYPPSATFTPTDWNDPAYRTRQLARMERAVDYASAHGLYVIINSHDHIPSYDETYATALWTVVAPYFANRTHVLYEASNEPMDGIGNNGSMTPNASDSALDSPRLQALKRVYNVMRGGAPDTHILILTPPGISDYNAGAGMGNLAASFAALPGPVDWTKTSVSYHLYNNDSAYGAATNAANLRNFHSRYPGWPSENNFPASVSNATLGITDNARSAQFDNDIYVNQTCERLGLGWSMWNINGQDQFDHNWPIMWADAVAKGWTWTADGVATSAPVFKSGASAAFSQNLPGAYQVSATGGTITYAASGLPAGLMLNSATGLISGTPTGAGKSNVTITATNYTGATTASLFVNILPTQDTVLYSETFSAGNTAGWFSYAGGSAGIADTLVNEAAAGASDGSALDLAITAPNSGWYAGMGIGLSGTPPFTSGDLARILVLGRVQISGPAASDFSVALKSTSNNQSLNFNTTAPGGAWTDFAAPLSAFTGGGFDFASAGWQLLLVPNSGVWGTGNFTLRLDQIQLIRRDDITDPLLAWRKIYFGGTTANTGLYADEADFDGDGLSNLAEYALGGDPTSAASNPAPVVSLDASNRLQITFSCDATLTNITYTVQTSTDLSTWNDIAQSAGGAPATAINSSGVLIGDSGLNIRPVTVTLPAAANSESRRFLRLRVTNP